MKKISLLLIVVLLTTIKSQAQYSAGFENWHSLLSTLTIPNGWNASDSLLKYFGALTNPGATFLPQVEQEMPGNASNTALKVVTKLHPGLPTLLPAGAAPCMASNCKINVNTSSGEFSFIGGSPYTYIPTQATMWVKNNVVGGDSTSITFLVIDNSDGGDSIVAYADTLLGSNIGIYTQLTMPFTVNPTPGFTPLILRVIVQSSGNFYFDTTGAFAGLNDGTWLVVDDINVISPAGVTNVLGSTHYADVYPTLVLNTLQVNLKETASAATVILQIVSFDGKKILQSDLNQGQNNVSLDQLSQGNYIYQLVQQNKVIQSGKIQKQ
jgi:hypothetical protein